MDPKTEAGRVLEEIRALIRESGISQRKIEQKAGFSKGYLSQLLANNLDLKYWHILAIVEAMGSTPDRFFRGLYPSRRHSALEQFRASSEPTSEELEAELSRLYGSGVESLRQLRRRLEGCEKALQELEDTGVLPERQRRAEG